MRRRIALQKHFVRNLSDVSICFAEALGVRTRPRVAFQLFQGHAVVCGADSIFRRFKFGEPFLRADNIGFIRAAQLKKFLLAT